LVLDPGEWLDAGWGVSSCRDCGASIVWAVTEAGARMPVDFAPVAGGRLELYIELFPDGSPVEPGVQRVRTRPADRPAGSPAWWSHWATCSHRRPPRSLPAELLAQLRRLMGRKWGPLFESSEGRP
jgi:hypothetical protein